MVGGSPAGTLRQFFEFTTEGIMHLQLLRDFPCDIAVPCSPGMFIDFLKQNDVRIYTRKKFDNGFQFRTASYSSITASVRPGLGDLTVKTWLDGKMPLSAVPLSGVGDKAAWVAELGEVVATKGNLLCDIQAGAGGGGKQAKASALCNKIFAAG